MAKLNVFDKVGLGEFIIKAAQFVGDNRERLKNDTNATLKKYLVIPDDRTDDNGNVIKHKITIHEDSEDETHMVLPWKVNVDKAMEDIGQQKGQIYPNEYRPNMPGFIDDNEDPKKALFFRFGEYMFGRCKH
jgi:hypothetical protein